MNIQYNTIILCVYIIISSHSLYIHLLSGCCILSLLLLSCLSLYVHREREYSQLPSICMVLYSLRVVFLKKKACSVPTTTQYQLTDVVICDKTRRATCGMREERPLVASLLGIYTHIYMYTQDSIRSLKSARKTIYLIITKLN